VRETTYIVAYCQIPARALQVQQTALSTYDKNAGPELMAGVAQHCQQHAETLPAYS
jgi:hypothetical protein